MPDRSAELPAAELASTVPDTASAAQLSLSKTVTIPQEAIDALDPYYDLHHAFVLTPERAVAEDRLYGANSG